MVVPVVVHQGELELKTYALLDDGADTSIVSSRLAYDLGLDCKSEMATLHTVEGSTYKERQMADFTVSNLDGDLRIRVVEALVSDNLTTKGDIPPTNEEIAHLEYMGGVVFQELETDEIDLILSVDHSYYWLGCETRRSTAGKMIAVKTRFGWTLAGGKGGHSISSCLKTALEVDNRELHEMVESLFRQDFPMIPKSRQHPSLEDEHAVKQMEETVRLDEASGHYFCGIPWKTSREEVAERLNPIDSSGHALKRLTRSIEKIKKNPPHDPPIATELQYVKKQLGGIFENGRAEFIEEAEIPPGVPSFVLPLHIVYEPNKPTKPRCCHDGASKLDGTCLNDHILTGPDLMNDLLGVIFRFRENKVTLSADIKGFFHQVYVDERDQYVFQFWWFDDEECTNPRLSLIKVHIFGAKSSPTVCTYVLRHHGRKMEGELSPEAAQAIVKSFYVDDLLASFKDVETARKVRLELTDALKKGGFDLLKWKSSHPGVVDNEEEGDDSKALEEKEDLASMDKVLGVKCSFKKDVFRFYVKPEKISLEVGSQRDLLKLNARCFDPLGIVAPYMLFGKRLYQAAILDRGKGWDDPLEEDLKKQVRLWQKDISSLSELEIPRWFRSERTAEAKSQLHIFSDSSQYGYGYVAYFRTQCEGEVELRFIFGKSKVIPAAAGDAESTRHHNSIPRFELTAGAVASIFFVKFTEEVDEKPEEVFFWTDSQCVLKQIRDRKLRHQTFVANRLSLIRTNTDVKDWHYVDTKSNPADLASRGIKAHDKAAWDIYLNGPLFLRDPAWKAPQEEKVAVVAAAVMEEEVAETPPPTECRPWLIEITRRRGRWVHKLRLVARLKRCGRKWRTLSSAGTEGKIPELSDEELEEAKTLLIKNIQTMHFREEIDFLEKRNVRSADARTTDKMSQSKLRKVNPFLDEDGVLRASTRLVNSDSLTYNAKCPIILPKNGEEVEALVRHVHAKNGHAGVDYTKNMLRKEFMILTDGQTVRRIIHRCVRCQKLFKETAEQQMAALPAERVTPGDAFEITGCDLFGPYELKCGRRTAAKRWVVIFTCFKVRAVHFEIVESLSSTALLNAVIRFKSRFPGVKEIHSDFGTNFVGAEKLLEAAVETAKRERGEELDLPIKWKRVVPRASHRAGLWERLIKSTKKILVVLLGKADVTLDVFRTVLAQAEYIMNHRPITHVASEAGETDPLTPAHFIHARVGIKLTRPCDPLGPVSAEDMRLVHNRSLALIHAFWKRWIDEYISQLRNRQKWLNAKENVKIDQLVMLTDETKARKDWRLARIVAVDGKDGLIRTVTVRTDNGRTYDRDVTKIVALEVD